MNWMRLEKNSTYFDFYKFKLIQSHPIHIDSAENKQAQKANNADRGKLQHEASCPSKRFSNQQCLVRNDGQSKSKGTNNDTNLM